MGIDKLLEKVAKKIQPKPQEEKKIKAISQRVLERAREERQTRGLQVQCA